MPWKIIRVAHNGTKGKRWETKTDEETKARIGRLIDVIRFGKDIPMVAKYLTDANGNGYSPEDQMLHLLKTSPVTNFRLAGATAIIETENSIYFLTKENSQ